MINAIMVEHTAEYIKKKFERTKKKLMVAKRFELLHLTIPECSQL